jgi:hypothetical protein
MIDTALPASEVTKHQIKYTKDKIKVLQAFLKRLEKEAKEEKHGNRSR